MSADELVLLIHGTGSADESDAGDTWWQADSKLDCREVLLETLGDGYRLHRAGADEVFHWSGENSESERVRAGEALLEHLRRQEKKGAPYHVVAHSHGGSILWHALCRSGGTLENLKSWTTLGTPFLRYRVSLQGLLYLLPLLLLLGFWVADLRTNVAELGAHRDEIEESGSVSLGGLYLLLGLLATAALFAALRVLAVPVAALRQAGYRRGERLARKTYGARWLGLWSASDEAINGLKATQKMHAERLLPRLRFPLDSVRTLLLAPFLIGFLWPAQLIWNYLIAPPIDTLIMGVIRAKLQGSDRWALRLQAVRSPLGGDSLPQPTEDLLVERADGATARVASDFRQYLCNVGASGSNFLAGLGASLPLKGDELVHFGYYQLEPTVEDVARHVRGEAPRPPAPAVRETAPRWPQRLRTVAAAFRAREFAAAWFPPFGVALVVTLLALLALGVHDSTVATFTDRYQALAMIRDMPLERLAASTRHEVRDGRGLAAWIALLGTLPEELEPEAAIRLAATQGGSPVVRARARMQAAIALARRGGGWGHLRAFLDLVRGEVSGREGARLAMLETGARLLDQAQVTSGDGVLRTHLDALAAFVTGEEESQGGAGDPFFLVSSIAHTAGFDDLAARTLDPAVQSALRAARKDKRGRRSDTTQRLDWALAAAKRDRVEVAARLVRAIAASDTVLDARDDKVLVELARRGHAKLALELFDHLRLRSSRALVDMAMQAHAAGDEEGVRGVLQRLDSVASGHGGTQSDIATWIPVLVDHGRADLAPRHAQWEARRPFARLLLAAAFLEREAAGERAEDELVQLRAEPEGGLDAEFAAGGGLAPLVRLRAAGLGTWILDRYLGGTEPEGVDVTTVRARLARAFVAARQDEPARRALAALGPALQQERASHSVKADRAPVRAPLLDALGALVAALLQRDLMADAKAVLETVPGADGIRILPHLGTRGTGPLTRRIRAVCDEHPAALDARDRAALPGYLARSGLFQDAMVRAQELPGRHGIRARAYLEIARAQAPGSARAGAAAYAASINLYFLDSLMAEQQFELHADMAAAFAHAGNYRAARTWAEKSFHMSTRLEVCGKILATYAKQVRR